MRKLKAENDCSWHNTIAYLYLPSDYSEYVEALLEDPDWIAPHIGQELRNILALYLRKELISMDDALEIQQQAENLLKDNEYREFFEVLNTTNESGCSAYDSVYLLGKEPKLQTNHCWQKY